VTDHRVCRWHGHRYRGYLTGKEPDMVTKVVLCERCGKVIVGDVTTVIWSGGRAKP